MYIFAPLTRMKIIFKISLFVCIATAFTCGGSTFASGQGTLFMTKAIVLYSKQIPLTQGKFTIVSYYWYDFLMQWKWYAHKRGNVYYATRTIKHIQIHRVVMGVTSSNILIDHKNLDGLDNTENNLRIATKSQNAANASSRKNSSSKYLGVSLNTKKNKSSITLCWYATISQGRTLYIGSFPYTSEGEILAAKAYNKKAKELHGEFANLNFK